MKLERTFEVNYFGSKLREISHGLGQMVPYLRTGTIAIQIHEMERNLFSVRAILSTPEDEYVTSLQAVKVIENKSANTPKEAFRLFEKMMDHYSKPFELNGVMK